MVHPGAPEPFFLRIQLRRTRQGRTRYRPSAGSPQPLPAPPMSPGPDNRGELNMLAGALPWRDGPTDPWQRFYVPEACLAEAAKVTESSERKR